MNQLTKGIFQRFSDNPILTKDIWPYEINSVFNPGSILLEDGSTLLFCRVEDKTGKSHLTKAISRDGLHHWKIDENPTFSPNYDIHDSWGVEDPRITYLEELKKYAIVYTAYGKPGPSVALALTKDFIHFERMGTILQADDKDAALFPKKIKGRYVMVHRPMTDSGSHMWISYSNDLIHWGDNKPMIETRAGSFWDANKIGLATPPIETEDGWLVLYHGVKNTSAGAVYRIGLALFDLEKPEICIKRGAEWVFAPETFYERVGDVGNVVFPCGYVILSDRDTIHLYYGAADTCIGVAMGKISNMLAWLHEQ